jgi:wyosine [tRNA(Phe)-imidazoG37] synthetase (radical SAM superfamily)
MQVERSAFLEPREILRAVEDKVGLARSAGEPIDYLTFVPDGEPTLDANLGQEIELLRPLGIPIAVISNSSLIWREDVRQDLAKADWVSLKVDSVREDAWRRVDRAHGSLRLQPILGGVRTFAEGFDGTLVTETMVVDGLNDAADALRDLAQFLADVRPGIAYLAIPTRPPAENWVQAPSEAAINRAYHTLSESVDRVEYLIGYEGNEFAFTGNVEEDLLSITAVHPMREDAVDRFLRRAGAGWAVVQRLTTEGQLIGTEYRGHKFYVRRLPASRAAGDHRSDTHD